MRLLPVLALVIPVIGSGEEVSTRVIDVGPGHASITKMPGPHYMVFDGGLVSRADHIITQIRDRMGSDTTIDLMVISHTDRDHLGAVPRILDEFEVRTVLRTGLIRCNQDDDCAWRKADTAIRNKVDSGETIDLNLRRSPIGIGYEFRFGEVKLRMISGFHVPPDEWGLASNSSDFLNAGSIVMRLEYDGKAILFTGDEFGKRPGLDSAMTAAEAFMVANQTERPLQSQVLVAAHHGADDASSTDFLKAVSPIFVVLPAGGSHQHPRQNTVTRMTRPDVGIMEANLFRTDQCDPPGPLEWVGAFVEGANDTAEDDDVDITLVKGQPVPVVEYASPESAACAP